MDYEEFMEALDLVYMHKTFQPLVNVVSKDRTKLINDLPAQTIARFFILTPNMKPIVVPKDLEVPDECKNLRVDNNPTELVLLKTLGYTKWNEIADLPEIKNMDRTTLSPVMLSFLQEVNVV